VGSSGRGGRGFDKMSKDGMIESEPTSADYILSIDWPERDIAIYALIDPRDKKPRYIGQSLDPYTRLRNHLASPHSTDLRSWFYELRIQSKERDIIILEWVETIHAWEREKFWIQHGTNKGWKLLNRNGKPLDIEKHRSLGRWLKKIRQELKSFQKELREQYGKSKKVMRSLDKIEQDIDMLRCALDSEIFKENPRSNSKDLIAVYYGNLTK